MKKGWKKVKLGDVCNTISQTHKLTQNQVVLINTSDVLDGVFLNHELVENKNLKGQFKKSFQENDILYSEIRPANRRFAFVDFDAKNYVASTKLMVLRNKEVILPHFLYQILKQERVINELQVLAETRSGTFPQITFSELSSINISLPSIKVQSKIAKFLSNIDEKIKANKQINDNLEEQAQALFKSWFVDFEPFKDGEFIESELGMIPKGWKVGQLSDVGEIIGGGTPSKSRPEYYTMKGISWITPKDLSNNNVKFTAKGEVDITEIGFKNSSTKLLPRGTVLYSSRAPIGYISIAKNIICTNQGFKSVVPKIAGTGFLYYFLKNNTKSIELQATGSTFKEASSSLMKSLKLAVPNDYIFKSFEILLAPFFDKQEKKELENEYLSEVRDTLLPKLMSGEISVEEIEF